jgi:hypothetical protein
MRMSDLNLDYSDYAVVKWTKEDGMAFLTLNVEGEDVLVLFESTNKAHAGAAAEAHAMLRNIEPGWGIIVGPPEDLHELFLRFVGRIEHLTINPPIAFSGEAPVTVDLIPLLRFLEQGML